MNNAQPLTDSDVFSNTPAAMPEADARLLALPDDEFIGLVADAFRNCHRAEVLAKSPLAGSSLADAALVPDDAPLEPLDRGRALCSVLAWAVNGLAPGAAERPAGASRPVADPSWTDPLWSLYNVLRHLYLEPLRPNRDADEAGRVDALLNRMGLRNRSRLMARRQKAVTAAARLIRKALSDPPPSPSPAVAALVHFCRPLRGKADARRLLAMAAVFRRPFPARLLLDMAQAEHVADGGSRLRFLLDHRMVLSDCGEGQIRVPARLRPFILTRAGQRGTKRWHARAADHYRDQGDSWEEFWHCLRAGQLTRALDLVPDLTLALRTAGLTELEQLLKQIPEEGLPEKDRVKVHIGLEYLAYVLAPSAEPAGQEASSPPGAEDAWSQAHACFWLAVRYMNIDCAIAESLFNRGLELEPRDSDLWWGIQLHKIHLLTTIGRPEEADALLQELRTLVPETDVEVREKIFEFQAGTDFALNRPEDAIRNAEAARALLPADAPPYSSAYCDGTVSRALSKLGDHDGAFRMIDGVLERYRSINYLDGVSATLRLLADLHAGKNEWEAAVPLLRESLALAVQQGLQMQEYGAHQRLARACAMLGDMETAAVHWVNAMRAARELSAPVLEQRAEQLAREFPQLLDVPVPEQLARAEGIAVGLIRKQGNLSPGELSRAAMIGISAAEEILARIGQREAERKSRADRSAAVQFRQPGQAG